MGLGTVYDYLERAAAVGIGWPLPEGLSEEELESKLFGNQPVLARAVQPRPQPDWKTIHEQLQQYRHLTLQLLCEEYRQANPEGYPCSWFCEVPKVNVAGIEETVTDKGYHSGAVVKRMKAYGVRSYIPEKKQKGRRNWAGKPAEQQAVYANRRRGRGEYGKSLLRRRGELVERSFAHCYETGAMRRCHLRGHENIRTRQLIHVDAFNLSLILRKLLGTGTPRELKNRAGQVVRGK